jgi:hypothetical protein
MAQHTDMIPMSETIAMAGTNAKSRQKWARKNTHTVTKDISSSNTLLEETKYGDATDIEMKSDFVTPINISRNNNENY